MLATGNKERPFLPPPYEAAVAAPRDLLRDLEFPANPDASLGWHLLPFSGRLASLASDQHAFFEAEASGLPEVKSPADQRKHFQFEAVVKVIQDLNLLAVCHLVSMQTGLAKADGQEAAVAKGYEIGNRLVVFRAQSTASGLLQAVGTQFRRYPNAYLNDSIFNRSMEVCKRQRKKLSFVATDEEWEEYLSLQDQAEAAHRKPAEVSPLQLGSSRFANRLRVAGFAIKTRRQHGKQPEIGHLATAEAVVNQLLPRIAEPLDLDEEQIQRSVIINTGVMKIIRTAARQDPSIRRDLRTQYAAYLFETLDGHDIAAQTAVFDRDVQKIASKEQRRQG